MRLALLAMLAGTVVLLAAIDEDASAEIVTLPLLLLGLGIGGLASQLGSVTVSAVPDELSPEVGGLQNTATNIGASLGTALAGSVLIASLTATLAAGIQQNPAVPPDVREQAETQLSSGVPFISDADLESALEEAGVTGDTAVGDRGRERDSTPSRAASRAGDHRDHRRGGAVLLRHHPHPTARIAGSRHRARAAGSRPRRSVRTRRVDHPVRPWRRLPERREERELVAIAYPDEPAVMRPRCRASVGERYDVDVVTTAYEAACRRIIDAVGRARLGGRAALRSPPDIG